MQLRRCTFKMTPRNHRRFRDGSQVDHGQMCEPLENRMMLNAPRFPQSAFVTTGNRKLLLLRVEFADSPGGVPLSDGDASTTASMFTSRLSQESYGILNITEVRVPPTITLPSITPYLSAGPSIASDALAAAEALSNDWTPNSYDYYAVFIPKPINDLNASAGGVGSAATRTFLQRGFSLSVSIHEFGHVLGAGHSGSTHLGDGDVVDDVDGYTFTQQTADGYGDRRTFMGGAPLNGGSFSPANKFFFNWLQPGSGLADATGAESTFALSPINTAAPSSTNLVALNLNIGSTSDYWVSYQPDRTAFPQLVIHHSSSTSVVNIIEPNKYTAGSPASIPNQGYEEGEFQGLTLGQTYVDPINKLAVTFVGIDSQGKALATVRETSLSASSITAVKMNASSLAVPIGRPVDLSVAATLASDPLASLHYSWHVMTSQGFWQNAGGDSPTFTKVFSDSGVYVVAVEVTDTRGNVKRLQQRLVSGSGDQYVITGRIIDIAGNPVAGAGVKQRAVLGNGSVLGYRTVADSNGYFSLKYLALTDAGSIVAGKPGYKIVPLNFTGSISSLTVGQNAEFIAIPFAADAATDDAPVPGVYETFKVKSPSGTVLLEGRWVGSLADLRIDDKQSILELYRDGNLFYQADLSHPNGALARLVEPSTTGLITSTSSAIMLSLTGSIPSSGSGQWSYTTRHIKQYIRGKIPSTTRALRPYTDAVPTGYTGPWTVGPGASAALHFDTYASPSYDVYGTVKVGGVAPTTALMKLYSGSTLLQSVPLDDNGQYVFYGVPAGSYTVEVTGVNASFTTPTRSVTVGDTAYSGVNFTGVSSNTLSEISQVTATPTVDPKVWKLTATSSTVDPTVIFDWSFAKNGVGVSPTIIKTTWNNAEIYVRFSEAGTYIPSVEGSEPWGSTNGTSGSSFTVNTSTVQIAPISQVVSFSRDGTQQEIQIAFSEDISGSLTAADLRLTRNGVTDSNLRLIGFLEHGSIARFAYGTGSPSLFPNGQYILQLETGSSISDSNGNPLVGLAPFQFVANSSDSDLDGATDFDDLLNVVQNYGQSGMSWRQGDFDYDGTVDFDDLLVLAQNYGITPQDVDHDGDIDEDDIFDQLM